MFRGGWSSSSSCRRLLPRRSILWRFGSDSFCFDVSFDCAGFVHRFALRLWYCHPIVLAQHRANRRPSRKIARSRTDSNDEVLVAGGGSIACAVASPPDSSCVRREETETEPGHRRRIRGRNSTGIVVIDLGSSLSLSHEEYSLCSFCSVAGGSVVASSCIFSCVCCSMTTPPPFPYENA